MVRSFTTDSPPRPPTAGAPLRRIRRHATRGFTILEVAMATFVMALGISASIITMQAGFRNLDVARGTTIAAQIIQSEMERIRMKSWSAVSALPATETFDGATYFSTSSLVANKYTITRTVADNATYTGDMKDITVSVKWKTYDGREHTRSYTALYAKNGLYDYYYTIAHP